MTSDSEVVNSNTTPKTREVRRYSPIQIVALLLGAGIIFAILGDILVVLVNTIGLSPSTKGSSIRTTQDAMMEEMRATIIASTEQALLVAGNADPDSPLQMARIHEFHEFLRDGRYDQAWCIGGRVNAPWPSSQAEFAMFWDANPAYLSAPVFPVQEPPDWFLVRIRWENSGIEEEFLYQMTYGFQSGCEGWIIAEVVPDQ
jgi:hypothetical protein